MVGLLRCVRGREIRHLSMALRVGVEKDLSAVMPVSTGVEKGNGMFVALRTGVEKYVICEWH